MFGTMAKVKASNASIGLMRTDKKSMFGLPKPRGLKKIAAENYCETCIMIFWLLNDVEIFSC